MWTALVCLAMGCPPVVQDNIKFFIFKDAINFTPEYIPVDTFSTIPFDPTKPVKILCHGWLQNYNASWILLSVSAYYKIGITNVISIDWSKNADNTWYAQVVEDAQKVAQIVGVMILQLCLALNIPLWNVHLIGNSLGAHVVGFAGKFIIGTTGQRVSHITGLDPAGPYFEDLDPSKRLSKTDASFVDIIHTDADYVGSLRPLGNIDYYPNGGYSQPGCVGSLTYATYCNHNRASEYFIESITSGDFKARKCESYARFNQGYCDRNEVLVMGVNYGSVYYVEGDYYFNTSAYSPYAIGDNSV